MEEKLFVAASAPLSPRRVFQQPLRPLSPLDKLAGVWHDKLEFTDAGENEAGSGQDTD